MNLHPKILIKLIISNILYFSNYLDLKLRKIPNDQITILMYHRVITKNIVNWPIQSGMFVTPKTFEIHIKFLLKYFEVVPISSIASVLKKDKPIKRTKPLCMLTFDDGWYDFYKYAFPLLKKYKTPAIVYLPTKYVGTNTWFWTDKLSNLVSKIKSEQLNFIGGDDNKLITDLRNTIETAGSFEKRLEKAINFLKPYRLEKIENILSFFSEANEDSGNPPGRSFLSWKEVQEMFSSGLVEFGGHTYNHRILTNLNKNEIEFEVNACKSDLINQSVCSPENISFSYPNGNYNKLITNMVKKAGFTSAVTTEDGINSLNSDPFRLKRIAIHDDISFNAAMFGCKLAGIF